MGTSDNAISRTWGCYWFGELGIGREWGERAYEAGEGEFKEEEIGGSLVAADFAEGDCAWFVAFWFARGAGFGL